MAVSDNPPAPKLDPPLLHCIDLSAFSQSELRTLCAISNSKLNLSNSDNLVIPQINPAVFNESAAGRKQTYSPRNFFGRRRFSSHAAAADESLRESKLIVGFFKQYMQNRGGNAEALKNLDGGGGNGVQIVNKHGVAVDLRELEVVSDPYGGELMRRTEGMEREEDLLGFLKGLEGDWCSRRKKRKIVDASLIGDALPVGWKIIIALRRHAGRFSPFCRRYISPTGEHLPSCKEVAAYLSSYFGSRETNLTDEVCVEGQGEVSAEDGGTNSVGFRSTQDISNPTKLPPSPPAVVYEDAAISGVGNLCDVQVRDFFECYKCKVKFGEKDAYVKHLLSSHENTPKRYRTGSPIGKGVIFRDGKYECQFCHKVFQDKKRYSGHVGVHVRNFNRGSEELKMPSVLSQMDAKNVIEVPSPVGGITQTLVGNKEMGIDDHQSSVYVDVSSVIPFNEEILNAQTSKGSEIHHEDELGLAAAAKTASLSSVKASPLALDKGGKSTCDIDSLINPASTCTANEERVDSIEAFVPVLKKCRISSSDTGSIHTSTCVAPQKLVNSVEDSIKLSSEKPSGYSGGSHSNIISSAIAPQMSISAIPESGNTAEAKEQGVIELDDLMLEDPECGNNDTVAESEPIVLEADLMKLNNCMRESELTPKPLRTVCVWCGASFYPEVAVSEEESESVGYMCTSCRTKISKQISRLERSWAKTSAFL